MVVKIPAREIPVAILAEGIPALPAIHVHVLFEATISREVYYA